MLSLRYSGDSDKDGSGKKTSSSGPSSSLPLVSPVGHELILGGQRSGKSRRAEQLAEQWLKGAAGRKAAFVATAQARARGWAELRPADAPWLRSPESL